MRDFIRRVLNVFYVRPCVVCGRPVKVVDNINLCSRCTTTVDRYGQTINTSGRITISVLPHKKFVRRAMNRFKFSNKKYYGFTFAKLIHQRLRTCEWYGNIECVVCVPMGKRNRLYNQSAVIARQVAERIGVPFAENAMVKVKDNPPFYKLTRAERLRAVKGAFDISHDLSFVGKRVLLIDDIYTTGATSSECRRVLLLNGAAEVYCATVCYAPLKERKLK
ncbi:MAG: ComF family protein [Clostridia bacterium]|nr:ComF family protein [Clostridia bacterium]